MSEAQSQVAQLRTLGSIRPRCKRILERCISGKSKNFRCNLDRIVDVADRVVAAIRRDYATLQEIPFHSRWRHFEAGAVNRKDRLLASEAWKGLSEIEKARRYLDIAIVSVLLDAGAGPVWRYSESDTGVVIGRSEGLGIASWNMFLSGLFSSDSSDPTRVDGKALRELSLESLSQGFQISEQNPMVGLEGRWTLLKNLGETLKARQDVFTSQMRPGGIIDTLQSKLDEKGTLHVRDLWALLIDGMQNVWPSTRTTLHDTNMGDVWVFHALLEEGLVGTEFDTFVPFHKLSQWLTYSLIEPFRWAGIHVAGLDEMTGLPEYRNGGLLIDMKVLVPIKDEILSQPNTTDSDVIVEWRALTVVLLDEVASHVRQLLGMNSDELPLIKILEAGTWKVGREVAKELRPDGGPPIKIVSDGTVF